MSGAFFIEFLVLISFRSSDEEEEEFASVEDSKQFLDVVNKAVDEINKIEPWNWKEARRKADNRESFDRRKFYTGRSARTQRRHAQQSRKEKEVRDEIGKNQSFLMTDWLSGTTNKPVTPKAPPKEIDRDSAFDHSPIAVDEEVLPELYDDMHDRDAQMLEDFFNQGLLWQGKVCDFSFMCSRDVFN